MKRKRIDFVIRAGILAFVLMGSLAGYAQVSVEATSGTLGPTSYTNLRLAFAAINSGTHMGAITIKISSSFTDNSTALLYGSATPTPAPNSSYTGINIYPTTTGLSISGSVAAPLIDLNGADNVTIDGRVNATGSTRSLTISNTSASSTAGTSTIRFINDASSNFVKYCTVKGSSTDAAAGIVFFSIATATTGSGNDNNTIDNNDITNAADASRPLNAVYALGATANNNGNTISSNSFFDFLSRGGTSSYGINISSYNSDFTISDNSFYEQASFTASAAVAYTVIGISAATGTGNGFRVSGNYIGGRSAQCGGLAWTKTAQNTVFTAISVNTATGTANSIQGNTIQKFDWTNTGIATFTGISLSGATVANIGTTTGNMVGAATGTGSITYTSNTNGANFYAISIASTDVVDCRNNTIGSITAANASTNATSFYGIYKSNSAGTTTISNNTIGSTTTAGSINASSASSNSSSLQSVYGIQSAATGTVTISGNTVANLMNATSNTTTGTAGVISGIYVTKGSYTISGNSVHDLSIANGNNAINWTASVTGIALFQILTTSNQTVSGNSVYNLSNSYASFAGIVYGIFYGGPSNANTLSRNFVHSLSVSGSSTGAFLYGIRINAGAATCSNNIVSLGGDTKTTLYGIYEGTTGNANNLYFNTVCLSGAPSSGSNTSYALYSVANSSSLDFRNNILVNIRSTSGGSNLHYAMYAASGGTLTCDYNNYFVSGEGGVLGYFGGANITSLPIVTGATGNDVHSIAINPAFINTGTEASEYAPTTPRTGVTGTGITTDYAGNTRGSSSVSMGAFDGNSWIGTSGTDWATASNWSLGSVPVAGSIINIPTGRTHYPALPSDLTVSSISLASGASMTLGSNNLTITSNLSNAGSIAGAGKLLMGGSAAQTISGTGTISNLEVNNSAGVTLTSGMQSLTGVLTPTAGALTTNGNLTLKSSASGTARVAALGATASISGNVTVERYIPAGRKWRFLAAPVKGSTNNSVFYNWQNNDVVNGSTGVEIWGPGGSSDPSSVSPNTGLAQGAGSSMRSYGSSSWQNVTNTNTTVLFDATTNYGFALFQTGPYGNGSTTYIGSAGSTLPTAAATTLSATGSLITGDHAKYFTADIPGQYFLVANPYASPVDPNSFTGANISNLYSTFHMWDAKQGGSKPLGRYVSYTVSGNTYSNGGAGTGYPDNTQIQSGQAFFVQANNAGAASLVFKESSKSATGSHDMFGSSTPSTDRKVRLFLQEDSTHIDGAVAFFRPGASAGIDPQDGVKLMNATDNLGLSREGRTLVFEFRPEIKANDTLFTTLTQMQQRTFRLRVALQGYTAGDDVKAELVDRHLQKRIPLSMTDTTYLDFTVTADSATTGGRFLIVFTKSASNGGGTAEPGEVVKLNPYPNPVVPGLPVRVDLDGKRAPWDMQLIDATGRTVWRRTVRDAAEAQVRIDMSRMGSGVYQLLMTDGRGEKVVSRVVKN